VVKIHTWPIGDRREPTVAFYATQGVDVASASAIQLRRVYRFARKHGLSPMMARITVVHAFQIGAADRYRVTL
jgi:hypothetical protein